MNDWKNMSKHQLRERMEAELAMQVPDREVIIGIMEELETRNPVQEIPVEAVLLLDKRRKNTKKKPVAWKRLGKAMIAAVLAIALLGIVPSALGRQNVFEAVGKWSKELFSFCRPKETKFVFQTDHPGLQELYDTVTELGVTQNVVPTWLPEGYELDGIEKKTMPKGMIVYAVFVSEGSEIQISFSICNEARENQYQKKDVLESFEHNGAVTYIIENNERFCAMWQIDNIECSVHAEKKDILYKIIHSIFRSN